MGQARWMQRTLGQPVSRTGHLWDRGDNGVYPDKGVGGTCQSHFQDFSGRGWEWGFQLK